MKRALVLLVFLVFSFSEKKQPFNYDLHLITTPGTNSRTMICCHGFGGNYNIAKKLREQQVSATLISFNFPDHDAQEGKGDPTKITFGTIHELLPVFYVLKTCVIDEDKKSIDLYGYSAGGGAVINIIATLNSTSYDKELTQIGIDQNAKKRLIAAIQNGIVILDTPLKSLDEIADLRGTNPELAFIAKRYRENNLRPIDSLKQFEGLSLDVILHFQEPDEILFNRDDRIFAERLLHANASGTTAIVLANDGGHKAAHPSLWNYYMQKMQRVNQPH